MTSADYARRASRTVGRWLTLIGWWLSYYLGIGQVFKSSEACEECGCPADEDDYYVARVGPRRIRCLDRNACRETQAEDAWYSAQMMEEAARR